MAKVDIVAELERVGLKPTPFADRDAVSVPHDAWSLVSDYPSLADLPKPAVMGTLAVWSGLQLVQAASTASTASTTPAPEPVAVTQAEPAKSVAVPESPEPAPAPAPKAKKPAPKKAAKPTKPTKSPKPSKPSRKKS